MQLPRTACCLSEMKKLLLGWVDDPDLLRCRQCEPLEQWRGSETAAVAVHDLGWCGGALGRKGS